VLFFFFAVVLLLKLTKKGIIDLKINLQKIVRVLQLNYS